jgi:hypothetical protein
MQLASLITFMGGGCEGGRGRAGRSENKYRPCTKCSLHACSFTLCLSFSYLRSAVAASFDIKKFHGNATSGFNFLDLLINLMKMMLV